MHTIAVVRIGIVDRRLRRSAIGGRRRRLHSDEQVAEAGKCHFALLAITAELFIKLGAQAH